MNALETTKQRSDFEAAALCAKKFMDSIDLNSVPEFGIEPIVVKGLNPKTKRIEDHTKKLDIEALAVSINLISANRGTFDVWNSESLSTALHHEVTLEAATAINRWLIDQGFVNRRSSIEKVLRNGRIVDRKIWKLAPEWMQLMDELTSQEVILHRPKEEPLLADIKRVAKGKSSASSISIEAIDKLNHQSLMFSTDTNTYCDMAELKIIKAKQEASRNRYGEITRAASRIKEDKIREIDAVAEEFDARGTQPFYLNHYQDSRGRIYAKGGWISTQASKLQKACIRFADEDPNCDMHEILIYLGRLAGCKGTATEAGALGATVWQDPTTYGVEAISVARDPKHAIVRLDGTCNGVQWISAFLNNAEGMRLTNLTGNEINDLYTQVQELCELESRDMAKAIVMPRGYGASAWSIQQRLAEQGHNVELDQIDIWLDQIAEIVPIDEFFNHVIFSTKRRKDDEFSWIMPDGFRVVHSYQEFDSIKAGKSFEIKLGEGRRDNKKMSTALPPNIIHSIDSYHARLVIAQADFPVIPIHDSFGCHSSNVPELREIIRETFKQVLREDVLNSIFNQIGISSLGASARPELITNPYMFS